MGGSRGEVLSECEHLSCALVRVVLDVTDVLLSPSSVVTEFCDVSSLCSDWEFVEPQSFSFSKKRALCYTSTQEEMRYEGSQVKAPSITRGRMTPPAPMQNSYTSFEREQGSYEGRGWNARERNKSSQEPNSTWKGRSSVKVRVEELEGLLGPEDVDVDFRRILKEARDERGRKIVENFSSDDLSFLVAEWSKWDKYKRAPWRQDSSAAARSPGTADSQLEPN